MRKETDEIIDKIYETLMAGEGPEDAVMIRAVELNVDIRVIYDVVEAMQREEGCWLYEER